MEDIHELLNSTYLKEIEEAVLGALLMESESRLHVMGILTVDSFYDQRNKAIFSSILTLVSENAPIDLLTVTNKLSENNVLGQIGGAFYVSQITNRVGSSANIEYHARLLKEKEITRRQIRMIIDIWNNLKSDDYDVFEANELIAKLSYECNNMSNLKRERTMAEIVDSIVRRMEAAQTKDVTGISCGHRDVDRVSGGWQLSDLIVLAARPAMGKTALALTWAKNCAMLLNIPVVFFSLEMRDDQLITRVISEQAKISSNKLRTGRLGDSDWKQIHESLSPIENMNLKVIDDHYKIHEIESKATELRMKGQMDIMLVDYLQLVEVDGRSKSQNREQEVSMITRKLKELAKRLDIPVIALSQLSRSVETRGDRRPLLSDLRESGAIEQDADLVLFLYRPEYYKKKEMPNGMSSEGLAILEFAKHRNGSLEEVYLRFIPYLTAFEDFTQPEIKLDDFMDEDMDSSPNF